MLPPGTQSAIVSSMISAAHTAAAHAAVQASFANYRNAALLELADRLIGRLSDDLVKRLGPVTSARDLTMSAAAHRHAITGRQIASKLDAELGEAGEGAGLGDDSVGDGFLDAAKREQRLCYGESGPGGRQRIELDFQPIAPALGFVDGIDEFLEDDLLGGTVQHEPREPAPMRAAPPGAAFVADVVTQQEGLQALLGGCDIALALLRVARARGCAHRADRS